MFQPVTDTHILEQRARQQADVALWPHQDEGVYRGYRWLMRRPGGTYWCGYVDLSPAQEFLNESDNHYDELESRAHFGITGGYENMSGFDCSHYADFYSRLENLPGMPASLRDFCIDGNATYKDHDYVLSRIEDMIDYLADNSPVEEDADNVQSSEDCECD